MEIKGTHTFSAPRDVVWDALMDPTVLAKALPGGEKLEKVDENRYKAAMQVRVGPVQGRFEGEVELTDIQPKERYRLRVSGQGTPGFVNGEGTLELQDTEDGGTLLQYAGEAQVGGRIASVGQRLLDSTARSLVRQGLQALEEQLQARLHPPEEAPAAEAEPAPANGGQAKAASATEGDATEGGDAQASVPSASKDASTSTSSTSAGTGPSATRVAVQVARDVAQDLASDYIPPEKQERVFFFMLGALAMLLFTVLVRLVQRD